VPNFDNVNRSSKLPINQRVDPRNWSDSAKAGLEFANNGISDSLTGSNAPSVFIQNLRRAVSIANRKPEPLTILTIKFCEPMVPKKPRIVSGKIVAETHLLKIRSEMEQELLAGARAISKSLRGGDFFSRMAVAGFWICLHSDMASAEIAARRFKAEVQVEIPNQNLTLEIQLFSRPELTTMGSWVTEVDKGYFKKSTQ
jgi:GGDEF domain-containing protein